jgi:hypothetical protein
VRTQIRDKSRISSHNVTKKPAHHLPAGAVNWRAHPEVSPATEQRISIWRPDLCLVAICTCGHNDNITTLYIKEPHPRRICTDRCGSNNGRFNGVRCFQNEHRKFVRAFCLDRGVFTLYQPWIAPKKNYDAVAKATMAELQTYERWIIRYLPCLRDLNTTVMFYLRI